MLARFRRDDALPRVRGFNPWSLRITVRRQPDDEGAAKLRRRIFKVVLERVYDLPVVNEAGGQIGLASDHSGSVTGSQRMIIAQDGQELTMRGSDVV